MILSYSLYYLHKSGPIVTWLAYIFTIQSYELTRTGNLVRREKDLPVFVVMKTELKGMVAGYSSQLILRNLIIAPITEEILFRALLTPTLFATYPSTQIAEVSRISTTVLVLGCPAFFAVAHLHHLYEKIRSGTKLVNALIQVLIQASYTYIFGCISMLLFIRTGSVFACITSHVICNFMGLPDTSFMNAVSYHGQYSVLYSYRFILLLLHGLGLVLFSFMLYPLITSFPTVYLSQ